MWSTLIRKELREALGIIAAAALAYFFIVAEATDMQLLPDLVRAPMGLHSYGRKPIPFLAGPFTQLFAPLTAVLAFALGLWQSAGEGRYGTYLLLLHLPMSRAKIVAGKLITGAVLVLALASVPILIVGWWADTPGTHASPFEWSMTAHTWQLALAMPTIYLGAFLSGLRPARWPGTRLLPAFACGALLVVLDLLTLPLAGYLAVLALADVLLLVQILYVARTRDFS